MDIEKRLSLIKEVGKEIVTEEELKNLLQTKSSIIAYDGFEPSGNVHIAQGVMRAINVNKMTKAGIKFKMLVADWHAWANNKIGGNLEDIQTVGNYLIETWKAAGMDLNNVEFVWANELVKDDEYWKTVMKTAINSTVKRVVRCSQIMGRSESDSLSASQIFYPCMQAADIFHLKADICQLGLDQRKVNMLAREIAPSLGFEKPIIVSHHMLAGLGQPPKNVGTEDRAIAMKMSKSNPETAIFMTDTKDEIKTKIPDSPNIILILKYFDSVPATNGPINQATLSKVYINPSFLDNLFLGDLSFIMIPKLVILSVWKNVAKTATPKNK